MKIYFIVEFLIVFSLVEFTVVVRMVYYLKINPKIIFQNLEVINYISVIYVWAILNFFNIAKTDEVVEIYDVLIPPLILFPMFLNGKISVKSILILIVLFTSAFHYFLNEKFIEILYIIAIFMLVRKAIKLSSGSSRNLKKSPLYIILTLDVFFTVMSVSLNYVSSYWKHSILITYYGQVSLVIFLLNLILFHVYIKRFFIN